MPERYNTNLAAEFWVLSALYRIGVEAHLTLGNKKGVDIVVTKDSEIAFTVEVKGLEGPYDWPANNIREFERANHVYAMVSFERKMNDPSASPSVWVIPAASMREFVIQYKTRSVVSRSLIKKNAARFVSNWQYISGRTQHE